MFKNIKKDTIIRTIVLAIALTNQLLIAAGFNPLPFESQDISEFVSSVVTVAAALWSWWKNNSFTEAALKADEYLKECKNCQEE